MKKIKKKKKRKHHSEALFQEPGTGNSRMREKQASFSDEEIASCGVLTSLYLKQESC